jgi:monoamine oxidase
MTRSFTRKLGLGAVCIGALIGTPALARAQSAQTSNGDVTLQSMVQMRSVAEQLGTKLNPEQREELALGVTLNGTLQEPEKLEKFGITGVHKGARVTAMRVAPQKVVVEVDEIEPTPLTRKATLRITEQGRLSVP